MPIFFGILTALTNAVAVTTQHIASTSSPSEKGWRLVLFLFRHPLWLFGWLGLVGSLVFQALALHFGPLSTVQPVLLTELVFALLLRRLWLRQSVRATTWIAAIATCVFLSIFLSVASPEGSPKSPTTGKWTIAISVGVLIIVAIIAFARSATPSRKAGLFAIATAISWALEACFIKAATDSFSPGGFAGALSRWPIYAFAFGGLVGLVLEQTTLHVGPLKVSLPLIVIADPIVSVMLGVTIFGEHFRQSAIDTSLGALAFAGACIATLVMTQTTPPDMVGDARRT